MLFKELINSTLLALMKCWHKYASTLMSFTPEDVEQPHKNHRLSSRNLSSGTVVSSWPWSLTSLWRGKWNEYFSHREHIAGHCIILRALSVSHCCVFVCVYFPKGRAAWRRGRRPWARRTGRRSVWSWRRCSWSSECKSSRFESSLLTRLVQVDLIL